MKLIEYHSIDGKINLTNILDNEIKLLELNHSVETDKTRNDLLYIKNKLLNYEIFNTSKEYKYISYGDIYLINLDGIINLVYMLDSVKISKKTKGYISSEYDWLLMIILIFSLVIILVSFVDYCFVSKKKYNLKIAGIFL